MIAQSLALQKHTFEGGLRPKEEYELIQRMVYLTWKQATRATDTAWWLFSMAYRDNKMLHALLGINLFLHSEMLTRNKNSRVYLPSTPIS